ncbi:MAG: dihydroorotase [Promethearchaeota archaeon]|jgi:dihydroorotase
MILKNGKIYSKGLVNNGAILIEKGTIIELVFNPDEQEYLILSEKNQDKQEIDCENRLILPGIIDIHSHLRDMGQKEKETFVSGTKAAAYAGITTIFNMPNTIPPAISEIQVNAWMKRAQNKIHVDVGFIAGFPEDLDIAEIERIIDLGVVGFKIYPLNSLNGIDWNNSDNLKKIFSVSSKFQIPLFIHAAYPLSALEKKQVFQKFNIKKYPVLKLHNLLNPVEQEEEFVSYVIETYKKYITEKELKPDNYPIIHFCHVSCKEAYIIIQSTLKSNKRFRISFEVTPHHLILSNEVLLEEDNYGKVLPPLRNIDQSQFLLNEFKDGNIKLIGTDHAPHTLKEKRVDYSYAPSGFPGFETYPLVILDLMFKFKLSLEHFVKAASENPAITFNLKNKGFISKGYDADLIVLDKIPDYNIQAQKFITKAKYTPFEDYLTSVSIWKVFLRGIEINSSATTPNGKVVLKKL